MPNNWKKELIKHIVWQEEYKGLVDFIETEIIEKLIDDCVDSEAINYMTDGNYKKEKKRNFKAKWLPKEQL